MANSSKEKNYDIKRAVKIALKTLLDSFVVIMFVMCCLFVVFPKTSLKIHEMLGNNKMQEHNYKMIYARSKDVTDLYNLIIFEGNLGNYKDELYYIDEMLARKDYANFCEQMDKTTIAELKEQQLTSYSANVNAYLLSRKVICMYNLQENGLETYVYRQTLTGKLSEYSFSTYVDLVYNDENLTKSQKSEKLSCLMDTMDGINGKLSTLVQARVDGLKTAITISDDDKKDVLRYALMRIYASRFYVYDMVGNEELKAENLELYKEIKTELSN